LTDIVFFFLSLLRSEPGKSERRKEINESGQKMTERRKQPRRGNERMEKKEMKLESKEIANKQNNQ
jgi:hypothetical protein